MGDPVRVVFAGVDEGVKKPTLVAQNVFPAKDVYPSTVTKEEVQNIAAVVRFPDGVVVKIPSSRERADWTTPGWVCFFEYPFVIGHTFPFSSLVRQFLALTSGKGRVGLRLKDGVGPLVTDLEKAFDKKWYHKFFFIDTVEAEVSKLKQRSQSPSLIDKLYELSADERSFIRLTQPEAVIQIQSLDDSDSEQKVAPTMSQERSSQDGCSKEWSSSIPPRTNLKRKLEMPIDVDAADFSFDSLAPHVDTLLFPSFKDRQSLQTFADLSQETAVQSFQSLQSFLGVLGKVSEFTRVYEAMKKERDALSDKYKAATDALKVERTKHRECIVERDGLKSTLKEAGNEVVDAAAYYFGKARLEMMEEFQQGKHEAWDYDADKAAFEKAFPEGTAAPGSLLLSFADEEVNSPHNNEVKDVPESVKSVAEEVVPADNMDGN
uniref:Uncharacterized protein n=1 Tax=Chenopodium quinoa TaxID=63459 RepID=A0A803KV04_CHEQI